MKIRQSKGLKKLRNGERVAVFRHEGRLSAISNACANQNGPLGEGKIIDCMVTCPWHGFQYRVEDGCAVLEVGSGHYMFTSTAARFATR